MTHFVTVLLLSLSVVLALNQPKLTPDTFYDYVGKDKAALVEFYAPWCGHCKNLAPEWELLGKSFESRSDVVIAALDADAHSSLAQKFGVTGFPTIKWFPMGSEEPEAYSGGRKAEDLVKFVNEKMGTNVQLRRAPSAVVELDDSNFDKVVLDSNKHVLVEFFAPWCGHCKQLAPTYEKIGETFAGEPDVIIAKYDADAHKGKSGKYGVSGFPTLKWFPKDDKTGQDYSSGRSEKDFVEFLNEKAGTERTVGGGYLPTAGRIAELDKLAKEFVTAASEKRQELIAKVETFIKDFKGKNAELAKFYKSAMTKIEARGKEFVKTEVARLKKLLDNKNVAKVTKNLFHKRINIVSSFENDEDDTDKDEL